MIGRTVGHYRILERLGAGGMGVVYKAEDLTLGRFVALKFLPPEMTRDPEAKGRFLREARAASQLDHPNICTIHEIGEIEDEQIFIAMAFYAGETLKARIERGPLDVDDALKIAEQVARGLGKAHASGIVHRDIKPANVIVTSDGVAKILDFGLAKLTGATAITRSHRILGTLAYMAPEQVRGEEVGPQADLWSLGALLFELLTARRPFAGETDQAVIYAILNQQPSSLGELRAPTPTELDRIIKKLLRKDPLQRYQTAEEVLAELETLRAPSSGSGKSGPRASKPRESLRTGARLGPYEIVELLGSGGMGDVYRARDTRLDRQVAIKVLAPEFLEDAERKQRFQREAKTISSLSHPNICTLFDVGEQEGTDYLVMEYLEGETLADRLTRGALPLNDVLKIGIQIGDALGKAHQQGIIHRDLKPGNVMLTKSGAVKLVDFGLAKDIGAITSAPHRAHTPDKPLTAEGAIVGTLAYMAPEQVEGREADARTDIFAFGAILYEMATGKRAFEGATKASLIVAILDKQPPLLAETRGLNESSARGVRALATIEHAVRQCLEKDAERRWQNAIDVANELRWVAAKGSDSSDAARADQRGLPLSRGLVAAAIVALLLAGAGAGVWLGRAFLKSAMPTDGAAGRGAAIRSVIDLRDGAPLAFGEHVPPVGFFSPLLALSHDGSMLAYVGVSDGKRKLFLRRVEEFAARPIDGTDEAHFACFSPDDRWLAFLVGDQVKKVAVGGGAPIVLANVTTPTRAVWLEGGIVVMSRLGFELDFVPEGGGTTEVLSPNKATGFHGFTDVHPGRKLALARELRIASSANYCRVLLIDLEKRSTTPLVERGFGAQFVGSRWISYVSDSNLYVVEFDLEKRRVVGEPAMLQTGVANESLFGQIHYAISDSGLVAFVPGGDHSVGRLTWIDRNGRSEAIPVPPALYGVFDLSPDGRRLAVEVSDVEDSIRVLDLDRGELRKLGIEGRAVKPVWIQGNRILFNWRRSREDKFKVVSTNDVGQDLVTVLDSDKHWQYLYAASWDGSVMATRDVNGTGQALSVAGATTGKTYDAAISEIRSEGDWFAWVSARTGRFETWVTPISDLAKERQVSVEGGVEARFCRACPWLFYRQGIQFYGVRMPSAGSSDWGSPQLFWRTDFIDTNGRSFDVSPDGQRLLVSRAAVPDVTDRIHLIQNWQALLPKGTEAAAP